MDSEVGQMLSRDKYIKKMTNEKLFLLILGVGRGLHSLSALLVQHFGCLSV